MAQSLAINAADLSISPWLNNSFSNESVNMPSTPDSFKATASHESLAPFMSTLLLSFEERYHLEHEAQRAGEQERHRLSVELHDGVCQQLSGIAFMAGSLAQSLNKKGLPEEEKYVRELTRLIRAAIENAKDVARELHPVDRDGKGLTAALRHLTVATSSETVTCELETPKSLEIDDNVTALRVYQIIKDAVTCATRHAKASHIRIVLSEEDSWFHFSIHDNGSNTHSSHPDRLKALRAMCHKAHAIGGMIELESGPEGGNVVRCIMPDINLSVASASNRRPD